MASISPDKHLAVLSLPRGDTSPTGRERVPPPGPAPRDQRAAGWPAAGAPQVGGTTLRLAAAGGEGWARYASIFSLIVPQLSFLISPTRLSHLPQTWGEGREEREERGDHKPIIKEELYKDKGWMVALVLNLKIYIFFKYIVQHYNSNDPTEENCVL